MALLHVGRLYRELRSIAELQTHVLLTKADKLKRGPAQSALLQTRKALQNLHPEASIQLFSAHTRAGSDELQQVLHMWLGTTEV